LESGWDLADAEAEGWTIDRVMTTIDHPEPVSEPYPDYDLEPVAESDFIPLGHDRGKFYFFTSGSGQVRDFTARDLQSVGCLLELAPLRHWEMNYPGKGEAGFNVRAAGDTLLRWCYRVGIYDPDRIRGRGAWIDMGKAVLHMGDKLIVDGATTSLMLPGSRHIYE